MSHSQEELEDIAIEELIECGLRAVFGQLSIATMEVDFKKVMKQSKSVCNWAAKSQNASLRKEARERILDAINPLHQAGKDEVLDHLERKIPEP